MARGDWRAVTHKAKGLSDARDGTNAFPGAMTLLQNLLPAPDTDNWFVPRPAALIKTTFSTLDAATKGIPNTLLVVGNIAYGMIPETSGTYSGLDVPFSYNILTNTFNTIAIPGGTASLPTSPATTGDWTPPTMEQVGGRIVVTHPGFVGGGNPFFGWLDVSSFSSAGTITGTTNTNRIVNALSADVLNAGWQVGMKITDASGDIPANTTITAITYSSLDLNTTGDTTGNNVITGLASTTGVVPGSACYIGGLLIGLVVTKDSSTQVTLNAAVPIAYIAASIGINFSGATTITISKNATGGHSANALTVAGGTTSAPLWSSGNTNTNPLTAVPVAVFNFNGSAWYAVGNGLVFSDPEFPCQVTNATQALNFQNGLPVTALAGLPYTQTTGGQLQALLAFQGDANIVAVSGSAFTSPSTLSTNNVGIGVGTLAPNTICNTPLGVMFASPDGVRYIDFFGNVVPPIGTGGTGVLVPFLNVLNPSRMAAAYNEDVYRISLQNGGVSGQPVQEYWYHISRKAWGGPHTFPAALIEAFQGTPAHGFLVAPSGVASKLFSSTVTPSLSDTYVENEVQLSIDWQTVLLPDNDQFAENFVTESMMGFALPAQQTLMVLAANEGGVTLGTLVVMGPPTTATLWGSFTWGAAVWSGPESFYAQYDLPWTSGLVFKQTTLQVSGFSSLGLAIGNLYFKYKPLGYRAQVMATVSGGLR